MKRLTNGTAYFVLLIFLGLFSLGSPAEANLVLGSALTGRTPGHRQVQTQQSHQNECCQTAQNHQAFLSILVVAVSA